jgi:segregation and condensation protein A
MARDSDTALRQAQGERGEGVPDGQAPAGADGGDARAAAGAFRVTLPPLRTGEPPFEGPLDLILHLVKEHEVDLFDIPIARITESYLATLEALRELDIDIAGEFLHMAAQLMLMKSKLLLPRSEVPAGDDALEEAGADPRAELVKRLLEYQKYKAAGEELGDRDILDRTVFTRRARAERPAAPEGPEGLADVSVFKLIEALDRVLANAKPEHAHEVVTDRLTISDAISRVAEVLRLQRRATFEELLAGPPERRNTRANVIATFLAILEMAKLKLVRIFQATLDEAGPGAEILVEAKDTLGDDVPQGQEDYR